MKEPMKPVTREGGIEEESVHRNELLVPGKNALHGGQSTALLVLPFPPLLVSATYSLTPLTLTRIPFFPSAPISRAQLCDKQ